MKSLPWASVRTEKREEDGAPQIADGNGKGKGW